MADVIVVDIGMRAIEVRNFLLAAAFSRAISSRSVKLESDESDGTGDDRGLWISCGWLFASGPLNSVFELTGRPPLVEVVTAKVKPVMSR